MRNVDVLNGDKTYGGPCGQFAHLRSVSNIFRLFLVVCLFIGTAVERSWEHSIGALLSRLYCLSSAFCSLRHRRLLLPLPHIVLLVAFVPHATSTWGSHG